MPSPVITSDFYLDIAGIPLATPAWNIKNLLELFGEADVKGEDTDVAHADGGLANPRRRAMSVRTLVLQVFGARDQYDAAYTDRRVGLLQNIAYLETNLIAPTSATVTATLHLPSPMSNRTGAVHVLGPIQWGDSATGRYAFGAFDIAIPAGRLT